MEISTAALIILAGQGAAVLFGIFLTVGCIRGILNDRNTHNDSK